MAKLLFLSLKILPVNYKKVNIWNEKLKIAKSSIYGRLRILGPERKNLASMQSQPLLSSCVKRVTRRQQAMPSNGSHLHLRS